MPATLPSRVQVYEVGPRDGLQNESQIVPVDVKVRYIEALGSAGLSAIEVSSLVRPGSIPQLADAEEVLKRLPRAATARRVVLVPNVRGLERLPEGTAEGIALFTAASETFSRRNTNASIDETFQRFAPVVRSARESGLWVRGYVSCAFGCPYEGSVSEAAVVHVSERLRDLGVDEIAISDTIGAAAPRDVERVMNPVLQRMRIDTLALHFHDSRGTALVNVYAALALGIHTFDSSAGGLGGCPYAPGATGNLATEDLIYMLDGLGIETGVQLAEVVKATQALACATGIEPPSRYYRSAVA